MRIKPTFRNLVIFSLIYQLYPIGLYSLVRWTEPNPQPWGLAGIFIIAEFLLVLIVLTWKRKADVEVIDERETAIQLKVKALMLNVTYTTMGVIFLAHMASFHEMPVWIALTLITVATLTAEVWGNRIYRKL